MRNLQHTAAAGQTAGESRRCERVEIGVAREPLIERLELLGGPEQQRRSVAAAAHRECDLGTQQLALGATQLVERACLGGGQQFQRGVGRPGLVFGLRRGRDMSKLPVGLGSHLDTQPTGGKYDGVLGTLAALEVVRTLNDAGIETDAPICICNWTNEEGSRFAPAMMAS